MADLRPLIRLHRWRLDEKQRTLSELRGHEDHLINESAQLEEEIKTEQHAVHGNFEVSFGYAAFARAAIGRRQRLAAALEEIRSRIAAATDALAEAFQELKRYELAQEERVKQEKLKLKHKENELLDETAAIGFQRKQQEASEN
ncbi:MAG: flagellar FliJ family protein [Rhodospirillaceae bacterium]